MIRNKTRHLRRQEPIAVEAGQRYLIRRLGKPALVVKISEVRRCQTARGAQPKAWYIALTRNGTPRRREHSWDMSRACAHLTWRDGAWVFPHGEEIR